MINLDWYNSLIKPALTPPNWIFAPVWGIIYLSILVSLIFYVKKRTFAAKIRGYVFFIIQMLLNILWIPAFFIFKSSETALVIIILLDIFVFMTIKEFHKVSKLSAYILIPYLIWILFATYLNAGIVYHNYL